MRAASLTIAIRSRTVAVSAAADVVGAGLEVGGRDIGAHHVAHVREVARRVGVAGAQQRLGRAGRLGLRDLARERADHVVIRLAGAGVVEGAHADDAQPVGIRVLAAEQVARRL